MRILFFMLCLLYCNAVYAKSNKADGFYKIGKEYTVRNKTYYPRAYSQYEEVGFASWYGGKFHSRLTANGEKFNKNALTAAHRTLPMPSIVQVINLENGRGLVLKINDRGPFVKGDKRIIDLSERAAMILGLHKQGLAKVKIKYLKEETERYIKTHKHYSKYFPLYLELYCKQYYEDQNTIKNTKNKKKAFLVNDSKVKLEMFRKSKPQKRQQVLQHPQKALKVNSTTINKSK